MSIDDTKKQDHKAPSAGITCSMNELINQAWDADFVSISQCLCFKIQAQNQSNDQEQLKKAIQVYYHLNL